MAKTATKPAVDPNITKMLQQMQKKWADKKPESKKPGGGGTTLSPGRHICRLTDAKIVSGDKGPYVRFEFTSVEGDETGEKAVRNAGFDTDDRILYLQKDLIRLGLDIDEVDCTELPAHLAALVESAPCVRITTKENGEYVNVYIDKVVEDPGTDGQTEVVADAEEPAADPEAEAVTEEPTETEEATEPEGPGFEVGDDVAYVVKGKKQTGVVKKIKDDETADIKNDVTKKVDNVDINKIQPLAAADE